MVVPNVIDNGGPGGGGGSQGPQGPQGPQGFQGWQGFQGIQGAQGFQGDYGPQGWQGPTGTGSITTISGDTLLDLTYNTVLVDTTGGDVTITLPTAASADEHIYTIKKILGTNDVIVDPDGAETVEDSGTLTISTLYQSRTIQSDGTEWWII